MNLVVGSFAEDRIVSFLLISCGQQVIATQKFRYVFRLFLFFPKGAVVCSFEALLFENLHTCYFLTTPSILSL